MVVFALALTVFIGAMMLGIDLSRLRTEAENAKRAAEAAALSGVVFLPDYPADAFSRAQGEAQKNGFVTGRNGVTITAAQVSGYSNRLHVTITEPVSLFFGGALGLNRKTISQSATAEYYQPLQTGAPDNVLGYAPFPTTVVTPTVSEGFYLENKGPYTYKESGDAYSPLFESYNRFKFSHPTDISAVTPPINNPCTLNTDGQCVVTDGTTTVTTTVNADHNNTIPPFNGYNYVVDDPLTNTLVIKLFDPYYEPDYDAAARQYDSLHTNANGHLAYAPHDSTNCAQLVTDCTVSAARPMSVGKDNTKLIDQASDTGNPFTPSSGITNPTTLEFTLHTPTISPYDVNSPLIATTAVSTTTNATCITGNQNCVWAGLGTPSNTFDAGDDPTPCTATACSPSPYAFRFLNYAIVHGPGIFHLNVRSVAAANNREGTGGNAYGIAVCGLDTNPTLNHLGVTTDPFVNNGATPGWDPASCVNPNAVSNGGACPTPSNPGPTDQCIHLYGLGRMAIHNWLAAGKALIPLGYIPPEYDGKTLQVRLYDVGDVSGSGNNIRVLTPAANLDFSHNVIDTTIGGITYPAWLAYNYTATPLDGSIQPASPYTPYTTITSPACSPTCAAGSSINVDGAHYNGTWLNIRVPLTLPGGQSYSSMVTATGGYWKVLYDIAGGADDATTWEISVVGSPVHLVN